MGQSFTKTVDLGDIIVSEGFIQGSIEEVTTATVLFPDIEVTVSPNPSFDYIKIRTTQNLPKSEVMIYDINGQRVMQKSFKADMQLQVNELPAGTYLLNWVDADQRLIRQFKVMKL